VSSSGIRRAKNRSHRRLEASVTVIHRHEEYDPSGFALLKEMQERHFWYRGRHRFLLASVHRYVRRDSAPRVIDLGGGCGGWVAYLAARKSFPTAELAFADSAPDAIELAAQVLPAGTETFQVDLLDLPWTDRWDVAFLLDVLEHIPDDEEALRQVYRALAPGGLLFVTAPALRAFWSWNDEVVQHVRRYDKADFGRLAATCGYRLLDTRYFMFFLSPLLLAARLAVRPDVTAMTKEQVHELLKRMHRVPPAVVNAALGLVFCCETPLGHYLPFPWGSSVLAVLEKPRVS
jgi:SAM-dependent methyltransferase